MYRPRKPAIASEEPMTVLSSHDIRWYPGNAEATRCGLSGCGNLVEHAQALDIEPISGRTGDTGR